MRTSFSRYVIRAATGMIAAGCIFSAFAQAQTPKSPADLFLANPALTLQQYPNGGAQLISLIRDFCIAHPESLQTIIGLAPGKNSDQQSAIGSGLGQCSKSVVNTNPTYANQIAAAIAGSGLSDMQTAYAGVTDNVAIASGGRGAGPGEGGGRGGGSGGSTGNNGFAFGGNNNGNSQFGEGHFQTSSREFTGGGGGVSGSTSYGSVSRH